MGERDAMQLSFWATVHREVGCTWERRPWIVATAAGGVIGATAIPLWVEHQDKWTVWDRIGFVVLALAVWAAMGIALRYIWCIWRAPYLQRDAALTDLKAERTAKTAQTPAIVTAPAKKTSDPFAYLRTKSFVLLGNKKANAFDVFRLFGEQFTGSGISARDIAAGLGIDAFKYLEAFFVFVPRDEAQQTLTDIEAMLKALLVVDFIKYQPGPSQADYDLCYVLTPRGKTALVEIAALTVGEE